MDVQGLEVGERLSEIQYYHVTKIDEEDIHVMNERGYEFTISHDVAEEGLFSANQYSETQKVNRTELAGLLMSARDTIFTVCFPKKLKMPSAFNQFYQDYRTSKSKAKAQLKKMFQATLKGEERILIGYLLRSEPVIGRSEVIDLEVEQDKSRFRLVDHRNLK